MTFVFYTLTLTLGYFVFAVLAVTRGSHILRVVLWPAVVLLAWRAAVAADRSFDGPNRGLFNSQFSSWMVFIVSRTFDWSLMEAPLVRHSRLPNGSKPTIICDAIDLATSLRGHGWEWSDGVYIPRETRPTSRRGFTLYVILSTVGHVLIYDLLLGAILSFSPTELGSVSGASIYDDTLPFYFRYLRSTIISVITAFWLYAVVQTHYNVCTLAGVIVFGQDPKQWPPAFDAPWRATSLIDFWGRRWHQFPRRTIVIQGGYPLSYFLGKEGFIIGAFLFSAMVHHIGLLYLNDKTELWRMLVGFGMMGPLVLAERTFKKLTGRRVEGWVGWIWTMGWLALLGSLIVDGFARAGMFGQLNFAQSIGHEIVERLVAGFDDQLHVYEVGE